MTVVVTDPISSPANPRLKAAAELRDRRARERTGLTIVDGAREVRRALDAGWEVVEAFVCAPLLAGADARAALDALTARGIATIPVTERAFAKVAFGDRAEGLVAVVRVPPQDLDGLQLPPEPLLVVLEAVEKPGNLGAVLRSADGAGADAVVGASPRTDLANPNVIRASAGTSFHVPTAANSAEAVLAYREELKALTRDTSLSDTERAEEKQYIEGRIKELSRAHALEVVQ